MTDFENIKIADYVKSKRRRGFLWGAGVMLVIGGLAWGLSKASVPSFPSEQDHIARFRVEGGIITDTIRQEMIDEIASRDDVKALIVDIDSPGGMVYPSYMMFERIHEIAGKIPTVAVMEDYAASGGLMVAMGAKHVIASPVTTTGSIGVVGEMLDYAGLMEKVGVGSTVFRTSDVKGGPSPYRKPSQAEIASINTELGQIFEVFKDLVAKSRGLSDAQMAQVATGDVFIGQKAVDLGLVDELGGEKEAIAYLEAQDPKLKDLEIVDWEPLYEPEENASYADQLANAMVGAVAGKIEAMQFERVKR